MWVLLLIPVFLAERTSVTELGRRTSSFLLGQGSKRDKGHGHFFTEDGTSAKTAAKGAEMEKAWQDVSEKTGLMESDDTARSTSEAPDVDGIDATPDAAAAEEDPAQKTGTSGQEEDPAQKTGRSSQEEEVSQKTLGTKLADEENQQEEAPAVGEPNGTGAPATAESNVPACTDGRLELAGDYEVKQPLILQGPCEISSRTGATATLQLWAPMVVNGSLSLNGGLRIVAMQPFETACVTVNGSVSVEERGQVEVAGCRNMGTDGGDSGHGGGLSLEADLYVRGNLTFTNCTAEGSGGAAWARGNITVQTGSLWADGCHAKKDGGAFQSSGLVRLTGGAVEIWDVSAPYGGAVDAWKGVHVGGGRLQITNASATEEGGAIFSRSFQLSSGSVEIRDVRAGGHGGAVRAGKVHIGGGRLQITDASATEEGGAIWSHDFQLSNASDVQIRDVRAGQKKPLTSAGGAVRAGKVHIGGGRLQITDASATYGGAIWSHDFQLSNASDVQIRDVRAGRNGGAVMAREVHIGGGRLQITNASATGQGGAIQSLDFQLSNASDVQIRDVRAGRNGGAVRAGKVHIGGGRLQITNASATEEGGAFATHEFGVSAGSIEIRNVTASMGGSIFAREFLLHGGMLNITDSFARLEGGAILCHEEVDVANATLTVGGASSGGPGGALWAKSVSVSVGANLTLRDCLSQKHGGAVAVAGPFNISSASSLVVTGSSARQSGGAVHAASMAVASSSIALDHCLAQQDGGGLHSESDITVDSSSIGVSDTFAIGNGGSLYVGGVLSMKDSRTNISQSSSIAGNGGGLHADGDISIDASLVNISRATATGSGGAVFSNASISLKNSVLNISGSSSSQNGGGVHAAADFAQTKGALQLVDCSTMGAGGGLSAGGSVAIGAAAATFRGCTSRESGAAIRAGGNLTAQELLVTDSFAQLGCAAATEGHAELEAVHVSHGRFRLCANKTATVSTLRCWHAQACDVEAEEARVSNTAECPRGKGLLSDGQTRGCKSCGVLHTRVNNSDSICGSCPAIPDSGFECGESSMTIPAKFMVDPQNLTKWFRCPNAAACNGTKVEAGKNLQDPAIIGMMCQEGYEGHGCTNCTDGFARSDADPLNCLKCSDDPKQVWTSLVVICGRDLALFSSAVATVTGAKRERAASSILLNQLMAFATVGALTMSGVMQTSAFHELKKAWLQWLAIPVGLASGQSMAARLPNQCLLAYFGYERALVNVHVMTSIFPAILVACLVVAQGWGVAVVVGINVFLPGFTANFGRYLVGYRLRPEFAEEGSVLHFDFLPGGQWNPAAASAILAALLFCFLLGAGSWIYMVRNRKEPILQHQAYLTAGYRSSCAAWEIERLVRKMLLALVATALPVSLSPALQMEAVRMILTGSLILYFLLQPYEVKANNRSEMALLFVALTITGLTTCLVANDLHWAKSALTQNILIFTICFLAAGVTIAMMASVAAAFYQERSAKKRDAT